ncbi:MAG: cytochrome c biogenesis protein ResB [Micrococcales bacterium]|nr:cytochrome c biogenesis protein ResB [Micrococcales bacterium]
MSTADDAPPAAAAPSGGTVSEVTVGDLFRRAYQLFYSKIFGLWVILVVTVLMLCGVLIGQASAGTWADPASREGFLSDARTRFGGFTPVLEALGLFRVFTSPLFYVAITLLALSIMACTVHRTPVLWRAWREPRLHPSDRFFDNARLRGSVTIDADEATTRQNLEKTLRSRGFRVIPDPRDERGLYADRFAWGGFGTVVAHTSFLIIIGAFVLSSSSGIDEMLSVPVGGEPVEVGHGTGLTVEATSFVATYNDEGRPLDYVSHLIVRDEAGTEVAQDTRVNAPLVWGGVRLHQNSFGIAADVRVQDASGGLLYAASVPLLWRSDDGSTMIGRFYLSGHDAEVLVATAASGAGRSASMEAGEASFVLYVGDAASASDGVTVAQGTPAPLGDLTVVFEREREYTGILVRHDPGAVWMWVGSVLLVVGMTITFACRHRRVWIRVCGSSPARVRFASNDKKDLVFERRLAELLGSVAEHPDVTSGNQGGTS